MSSYSLTADAEDDYRNIFDFGLDTFGAVAALSYISGLDDMLSAIAETPLHHQRVEDQDRYRRAVYRSHVIYYRQDGPGIKVMRILGRQLLTLPEFG